MTKTIKSIFLKSVFLRGHVHFHEGMKTRVMKGE